MAASPVSPLSFPSLSSPALAARATGGGPLPRWRPRPSPRCPSFRFLRRPRPPAPPGGDRSPGGGPARLPAVLPFAFPVGLDLPRHRGGPIPRWRPRPSPRCLSLRSPRRPWPPAPPGGDHSPGGGLARLPAVFPFALPVGLARPRHRGETDPPVAAPPVSPLSFPSLSSSASTSRATGGDRAPGGGLARLPAVLPFALLVGLGRPRHRGGPLPRWRPRPSPRCPSLRFPHRPRPPAPPGGTDPPVAAPPVSPLSFPSLSPSASTSRATGGRPIPRWRPRPPPRCPSLRSTRRPRPPAPPGGDRSPGGGPARLPAVLPFALLVGLSRPRHRGKTDPPVAAPAVSPLPSLRFLE